MKNLVLLVIMTLLAPASGLASILDQSFDTGGSGGGLFVSVGQEVAQTFTVGLAGVLEQVDVQARTSSAAPNGPLTLSILSTSAGDPSTSLGSVSIPQAAVPPLSPPSGTWVSADVSSLGISVNPGDVLAIALSYTGTGSYVWLDEFPGSYAGGSEFASLSGGPWISESGDLGFQTFVAPIVPESASIAIWTLLAGSGIGLVRSPRKRAA